MANESIARTIRRARPEASTSGHRGAVVGAGSGSSRISERIAGILRSDPRFFATKTIAEAIELSAGLVVVPEASSLLEEAELLLRAREGSVAGIFFSDDPIRRVALLRTGATDVLSPHLTEAEILCRIDRALEASIQIQADRDHQAELESLAYTDGLTGLSNRRFFDEILRREVARANRFRRPMSLVLIDIDHFKRINDLLGHAAGDQLLVKVAEQIQAATRTCDCAARFGGDELAAILGDIDASGARTYAMRIVKGLSEVTLFPDVPDIACSLSIGIASYGIEPTSPADLLRRADRALYRAKALGRGRIEIESW